MGRASWRASRAAIPSTPRARLARSSVRSCLSGERTTYSSRRSSPGGCKRPSRMLHSTGRQSRGRLCPKTSHTCWRARLWSLRMPGSLPEHSSFTRPDLLAGEQFPPPPQQDRSRRKREALLNAALEMFAEHGYERASIEAIARRAGVAVGAFYQHFTSKRQILLVLMDRLLEEVEG